MNSLTIEFWLFRQFVYKNADVVPQRPRAPTAIITAGDLLSPIRAIAEPTRSRWYKASSLNRISASSLNISDRLLIVEVEIRGQWIDMRHAEFNAATYGGVNAMWMKNPAGC